MPSTNRRSASSPILFGDAAQSSNGKRLVVRDRLRLPSLPHATLTSAHLCAKVEEPPRATTEAGTGKWITVANLGEGAPPYAGVDIADRPAQAWLRVTATSSYRLALNGILLDQQEDQLAALVAVPPVQRTYDISRLVRRGRNVLASC